MRLAVALILVGVSGILMSVRDAPAYAPCAGDLCQTNPVVDPLPLAIGLLVAVLGVVKAVGARRSRGIRS